MQITIVFPFRNRDIIRVKRALKSLALQSNKNFKVFFIDYGSTATIAGKVSAIVAEYDFVKYHYLFTENQPWNKSKALNYALRLTSDPYFFVADIDMIFRHDFVQRATDLIKENPGDNVYFKVGFLSAKETTFIKKFEDYRVNFESSSEATGLTLFSTTALNSCDGFDEFYHFWGAEDTDVHVRLKNAGYAVVFFEKEILMLHQWHPSYRSLERVRLTQDLQLSGVVRLNHLHLQDAVQLKRTKSKCLSQDYQMFKEDIAILQDATEITVLLNKKEVITHFLFVQLPRLEQGLLKVRFVADPYAENTIYQIKRILGKKVPVYYSLKEINDQLLLHIISFYHHFPYIYQVSSDLKSITFAIKK